MLGCLRASGCQNPSRLGRRGAAFAQSMSTAVLTGALLHWQAPDILGDQTDRAHAAVRLPAQPSNFAAAGRCQAAAAEAQRSTSKSNCVVNYQQHSRKGDGRCSSDAAGGGATH